MKELWQILQGFSEVQSRQEKAALATVVRVQGSAYRREGAKLFITEQGKTIGNISAGCLEGDVLEFTQKVIETKQPVLRHYGLMGDDELIWGFGSGCNGIIDVLIEPLETVNENLKLVSKAAESNSAVAIATIVFGEKQPSGDGKASQSSLLQVGHRLTVFGDGSRQGTLGVEALDRAVADDAIGLIKQNRSRTLFYDPNRLPHAGSDQEMSIGVFIDTFVPPETVLIFGAGPDAVPLVKYAKEAGFLVKVVDHRPAYAISARLPAADEVLCLRAEEVPQKVALSDRTYVVVLTHNFNYDTSILTWLLESKAAYIGVLGPKERFQMMLDKLVREGRQLSDLQSERLFTPVGVDIGAEGPEQIALSIVAEILAVKNKRGGAFLRERHGPMHV